MQFPLHYLVIPKDKNHPKGGLPPPLQPATRLWQFDRFDIPNLSGIFMNGPVAAELVRACCIHD